MKQHALASPQLAAALEYAASGWAVFPLQPAQKSPWTRHGFKDAATDIDQVQSWWSKMPHANIGIATGSSSQLVIIDLDGEKSQASLEEMERAVGEPLPPTYQVRTGRADGGTHHYYALPAGVTIATHVGLFPGIDIKAEGGYVVAPPSIHPDTGRSYQSLGGTVAELPAAWIVYLQQTIKATIRERTATRNASRSRRSSSDFTTGWGYWVNQALGRASEGYRNVEGFWLACQLRDNDCPIDQAEDLMLRYAHDVVGTGYTEREALASWKSAMKSTPREPAKSAERRAREAAALAGTGSPQLPQDEELNLRQAGTLVETLGSAIFHGAKALENVPGLLKQALEHGAWRDYETHTGDIMHFEHFADFLATPPSRGPGANLGTLQRMVFHDLEARAALAKVGISPVEVDGFFKFDSHGEDQEKQELRAKVEQLEAELEELRAAKEVLIDERSQDRKEMQREADILSATDLTDGVKVAAIGFGRTLRKDFMREGPDGDAPVKRQWLGKACGWSDGTVSKYANILKQTGVIRLRTTEETARNGTPYTQMHIGKGELYHTPRQWAPTEAKARGGARPGAGRKPKCPQCGSESIGTRTVIEMVRRTKKEEKCGHCGLVLPQPEIHEEVLSTVVLTEEMPSENSSFISKKEKKGIADLLALWHNEEPPAEESGAGNSAASADVFSSLIPMDDVDRSGSDAERGDGNQTCGLQNTSEGIKFDLQLQHFDHLALAAPTHPAPARSCFRCRTQSWEWRDDHWVCGTCQPIAVQVATTLSATQAESAVAS